MSNHTPDTHAIFEDAGKLLGGRILSDSDASAQIELDSGKRLKVKAANILLRLSADATAILNASAARIAEVDLQLAWECAPETEFDFQGLSVEYFGAGAGTSDQVTMLLALQAAPHYFRRGSKKGTFKKAEAAVVAQALAAIEKRAAQQAQIEDWAAKLQAGSCPEPIKRDLFKILFKPDKNAPEYKAVVLAAKTSGQAPLPLLQAAGALGLGAAGAYQFHWQRFLFDTLIAAKPHKASEMPTSTAGDALPLANVQAFSIDDSATTEIDDALSVQGLGTHEVTLGIHIAAPSLAIQPDDAVDKLARERYSTIYMPGNKITMLPDALVQPFTLGADQDARPAVSLYVRYNAQSLEVLGFESRLERVPVVANLRYDKIDHVVKAQWLGDEGTATPPDLDQREALLTVRPALSWLWQLAQHLKANREAVRGKPETFNRPDYSFKLDKPEDAAITGDETVLITERVRGAPLDLIVAECMIVANSTWGAWLASLGVPAIYRSQASLAFGVKVKMGTKSLPHAGIGVPSYAWSTSPLRRYTDLVNQWQIVAAIQHGATAALAAPFKPKDAQLFAIISGFEAAYKGYADFQNQMERFWTLRYVQQHGLTELTVSVLKNGDARAVDLPLMLPVMGAMDLPRGTLLRIRLGDVDLMNLSVTGTVLEKLSDAQAAPTDAEASDEEEDGVQTSSIGLAIDITEEPPVPSPA